VRLRQFDETDAWALGSQREAAVPQFQRILAEAAGSGEVAPGADVPPNGAKRGKPNSKRKF
jgi:hypothetical protein